MPDIVLRFALTLVTYHDHLDRLDAHEVGQLARVEVVLVRDVSEGLVAATHGLELGHADARAVEAADDVLRADGGAVWVLGVLQGRVVCLRKCCDSSDCVNG